MEQNCDEREPELEKSMRILRLSNYRFDRLKKLCSRKTFDALIWISDNKVRVI